MGYVSAARITIGYPRLTQAALQWLEAFVKHGTSQIEGVAAGVQQLCKDLGPIPELQDAPPDGAEGGDEEGNGGDQKGSGSGLLHDVRQLLVENKEREQSNADMHSAVNGLIAAVQEDMRRNAEARSALSTYLGLCFYRGRLTRGRNAATESVFGMIDQQRQDQERMLRALATGAWAIFGIFISVNGGCQNYPTIYEERGCASWRL